MRPKALVLHAAGINRDVDVEYALELAGAEPLVVHVNRLRKEKRLLADARLLVVPGGFSYADALGAGRLFALDLASFFGQEIAAFVERGLPVIGICNGFQTLVKAGILPGLEGQNGGDRKVTLTRNENRRFECRWVSLGVQESPCVWTSGISESVTCPVAHGEGRFVARDDAALAELEQKRLVALRYVMPDGRAAEGTYPDNPNGSVHDIAGICNERGNVLGLMPHPEDNVIAADGRIRFRHGRPGIGLDLFNNGVNYANEL
jgi:phosphoribosylformylglycinamidine synthase